MAFQPQFLFHRCSQLRSKPWIHVFSYSSYVCQVLLKSSQKIWSPNNCVRILLTFSASIYESWTQRNSYFRKFNPLANMTIFYCFLFSKISAPGTNDYFLLTFYFTFYFHKYGSLAQMTCFYWLSILPSFFENLTPWHIGLVSTDFLIYLLFSKIWPPGTYD